MPIYQVTNRKTHARAVIVAANEQAAVATRPDGALWQRGQWMAYRHELMDYVPAPALPCWPVTPEHACADLLARSVESIFDVGFSVVAFDRNDLPRSRGEGPDHWWDGEDEP